MGDIFPSLSLIIAIATGMALLMRVIGQPMIIGHIITGILVGPAILHIGNAAETFNVFSEIGIALLLFIIGLGLNPRAIQEVGKSSGVIGSVEVFAVGAIGWLLGVKLGLGHTGSLFFGIALAFSSTIIALKLLSDKHEQNRLYGRLTTGILLTQDIVATFALLLAASGSNNHFALGSFVGVVIKGLALGWLLYRFSTQILPRFSRFIATSQEFLFLFAIGWALGVAALFAKAGLSLEIGALFGGICLAGLPYAQEITARLRPVRDFFVVVFFITLGSNLSFHHVIHIAPTVLVGLVVVMFIKPLTVLLSMGRLGYTKRTAFKSALAVSQASEFSVVLAVLGVQHNLINPDLAVALTFITLFSIAGSTYLILFSERVFKLIERRLSLIEHGHPRSDNERQKNFELVLFGYQKGGQEFIKTFKQLGRDFVVVDYDPEIIEHLERQKIEALYGDATDPELLDEAGLDNAKLVVSAISDHPSNLAILNYLEHKNPNAVAIFQADTAKAAVELYEKGASYVMLPHFIGSEQIGAFIKKSDLKKTPFNKYKNRHLSHLRSQQKRLLESGNKEKQDKTKLGQSIVNLAGLKPRL